MEGLLIFVQLFINRFTIFYDNYKQEKEYSIRKLIYPFQIFNSN